MNESWMTEREQSAGGGLEERRVQIDAREDREPGLLVAGLDIGSTKICAMIGEVFPDRVDIIILFLAVPPIVQQTISFLQTLLDTI